LKNGGSFLKNSMMFMMVYLIKIKFLDFAVSYKLLCVMSWSLNIVFSGMYLKSLRSYGGGYMRSYFLNSYNALYMPRLGSKGENSLTESNS
jgi:hypothetical protein